MSAQDVQACDLALEQDIRALLDAMDRQHSNVSFSLNVRIAREKLREQFPRLRSNDNVTRDPEW